MPELSNTNKLSWKSTNVPRIAADGKKPYSQPQLIRHGDLRGSTLGGSLIPSDSGGPGPQGPLSIP